MNTEIHLIRRLKSYQAPKITLISITERGYQLGQTLLEGGLKAYDVIHYAKPDYARLGQGAAPWIQDSVVDSIQEAFRTRDVLICIMACGIAVRAMAPLIRDKIQDPAVLVLDDQGQHVISLLSGHVGQGNHWSRTLAAMIGATPVITTATDLAGRLGLDEFALSNHCLYRDFREKTKQFNGLIAQGAPLKVVNRSPFRLDSQALVGDGGSSPPQGLVVIDPSQETPVQTRGVLPVVQLLPRSYIIGIGCRKASQAQVIRQALDDFLRQENIDSLCIHKLVSIDLKQDEDGIHQVCEQLACEFETFPVDLLKEYEGLYPGSAFVKETVGIASVSQTAAHHESQGKVMSQRYAKQGVTLTLAHY